MTLKLGTHALDPVPAEPSARTAARPARESDVNQFPASREPIPSRGKHGGGLNSEGIPMQHMRNHYNQHKSTHNKCQPIRSNTERQCKPMRAWAQTAVAAGLNHCKPCLNQCKGRSEPMPYYEDGEITASVLIHFQTDRQLRETTRFDEIMDPLSWKTGHEIQR